MRSQFLCTSVAVLLAPGGALAQSENCLAPATSKEQVLLQSRAALHVSRLSDGVTAERRQFDEEARFELRTGEKTVERRRHVSSVMEQATELIRHGIGAETMATAGQAMEVIDEKVLPEIMAEHKSASLLLELASGTYELAEGVVQGEVQHIAAESTSARKYEAAHVACRKKEASQLAQLEACEKELVSTIEADARSHVGPHPAGAHTPAAHQPGMDASREKAKKNQCESLSSEHKRQRSECEGDQHSAEQEFCKAHSEATHARGKLADNYAMALSAYEAAIQYSRAEEKARKMEFGVVEAVRCLKEHFLAATEGSVSDLAWLDECKVAESEASELNLSYEEPKAWAYSLSHESTSAAEVPCTPEFLHARLAKLPQGVKLAPCTLCMTPSDKPISTVTSSSGHGGHSEKFWFGFHQGVRAASGKDKGGAAHVETFEKKIAAEGVESNFARFHDGLSKQILHRLPDDWSASLNQEIHHGFMNGFEAAMDVAAEENKKKYDVQQQASEEKIDKSLERAQQALDKAMGLVKAAHSKVNDLETKVSSGFSKVSESVEVLPFGEI